MTKSANLPVADPNPTPPGHSGIIGSGAEMKKVFNLVSQVAPSDSTVLLLGETGTGKELIARAIHNASGRRDTCMTRLNCAALPASLVESELFGHEKGSFTGALERRIGKFELANNSTLFLDEIGDLPLELQVKLLRALQEKEIERIGGRGTIRVNTRIIAATNRNLAKDVEAGAFRADLYYRINVFPITLPPLRHRMEDIPALAAHFVKRAARSAGKKVTGLSHKVLDDLMSYNWPGNVRELENLVERSVLLAEGSIIRKMPLPRPGAHAKTADINEEFHIRPLEEVERDYILKAIRICNGRVSGPHGAAIRLGLPSTTLISKMQKLGIRKKAMLDTEAHR